MEAGDKEYKDMIAESQLDNIFNWKEKSFHSILVFW
jgi:hypothetical protein